MSLALTTCIVTSNIGGAVVYAAEDPRVPASQESLTEPETLVIENTESFSEPSPTVIFTPATSTTETSLEVNSDVSENQPDISVTEEETNDPTILEDENNEENSAPDESLDIPELTDPLPEEPSDELIEEPIEDPIEEEPSIEDSSDDNLNETIPDNKESVDVSEEDSTTNDTNDDAINPEDAVDNSTEETVLPEFTDPATTVETPIEEPPAETPAPPVNYGYSSNSPYVSLRYSENISTEKFIAKIGEQAREIALRKDLYASVMIAQAILESGSGNSSLSKAPYNNLFGIKGSYKGECVVFSTSEDDGYGNLKPEKAAFRKYETVQDSLEDYAALLTEDMAYFYSGALKSNNVSYRDAAIFLEGRYATDTNYCEKLIGLIETYDLTRFDVPKTYEPVDETIDITKLAAKITSYLGTPYVWGGTTPDGFDCSGLVQYCYREALNIDIPRVTYDQQHVGELIDFDKLQFGDLLFFNETGYDTHHVAMYLGDGFYIHAPHPGDYVKITAMEEYMPTFARRIVPSKELTPEEQQARLEFRMQMAEKEETVAKYLENGYSVYKNNELINDVDFINYGYATIDIHEDSRSVFVSEP